MATKKTSKKAVTKTIQKKDGSPIRLAFNSSMPRSGSELLQGILSQHPEVCAGTTSPLLEYVYASFKNFKDCQEAKSQKDAGSHFYPFVKGGVSAYAETFRKNNESVYLDKSRGWVHYRNIIQEAFGCNIPVVCMVRDIADIAASMERIWRKNEPSHLDPLKLVTMEERISNWFTSTPIGLAIRRIQNALSKNEAIFFCRYEDLCLAPEETMKQILQHLSLSEFKFDFENIEKATSEDELAFGFAGLHSVQTKLRKDLPKAEEVLGEQMAKSLREEYSGYQNLFKYQA